MAKEPITVDVILETLQKWVEEKQPIGADLWLEAAQKLTVLSGDDQNSLFELEQTLAKEKVLFMESGDSVAKANVKIQARNEFVEARKLEAKIERITELVRISKLQARMSHEGMNNY